MLEEKEFDDIENSDFSTVQDVETYNPKNDRYTLPDVSLNKAQQESTELISNDVLEQLNENDPFAELINECRFGDMKKFKGRIQKIQKMHVKNPAFWNIVASCYIHQRDWPKAKIFIERSLSLVSNYVPAINNYGIFQAAIGDDSMALQMFLQASKGQSVVPKINLSLIYLKYFHAEKALKIISTIQGSPHWKVNAIKGSASFMLGNPAKAVEFFQAIQNKNDLEKSNFNINYSLAIYQAGDKEKAKDQYLKGADHYKISAEMVSEIQKQLGI
jgi:Tfp pilus assembly protein PilF